MSATLESKIQAPEEVLFRELDGEAVILHLESGKYFGLDKVGTHMWSLLSEHGQVEPAYQALLEHYEVEAERLQGDLLELIDKLAEQGLLVVDEE